MNSAVSIRSLCKTYRNGFIALKGIDLEIHKGDFFALLGPNGAGKSTTLGIITSLINKTSGNISIFGHDIDTHFSAAKQHLGVVPQEFNFSIFEPVNEIVTNQAGYYGVPRQQAKIRGEKYLKLLDLWDKRDTEARHISGGMKRRMMIARSMVHEPDILILDEPTAGVDIEIRRSMWRFLKDINDRGTTIILTTHYLEEAEELCKKIAIIDEGEIIENTTMKHLLSTMNMETFVLDVIKPMSEVPKVSGLNLTHRDELSLELTLDRSMNLNDAFSRLSKAGIKVSSMRNKTSRLEELFLNRINTEKS